MKKHKNKFLILACIFLSCLIVLFILWLYRQPLTPAKTKIFNSLPLPMAIVNGRPIKMSDFILRSNLAGSFAALNPGGQTAAESQSALYQELIKEAETDQLAVEYGVSPSQKETDAEYANEESAQGVYQLSTMMRDYSLTEQEFKTEIIKPQLQQTDLKIWFNSQANLNQQLYQTAQTLADEAKNGQDFGTLAGNYSQDSTSKIANGDLGFIDPAGLLPELRQPVSEMAPGDIKIIPSRYGLHIFKAAGKNGNSVHLFQIFLQDSGYPAWYGGQIKNFKVISFISLK